MGPGWILETVVSGGQTGVDQVALEVAQGLNLQTGGVAPRGWRTDDGPAPWLGTRYGLVEHAVSDQYGPRTRENVRLSDATVIFSKGKSPGSALTMRYCGDLGKPFLLNPTVSELQEFILRRGIKVLNVAGNRLRTFPESAELARVVLSAGLLPF